ncbi:MAG: SCO family protein [Wenzhouxiangellaceae bacterium]
MPRHALLLLLLALTCAAAFAEPPNRDSVLEASQGAIGKRLENITLLDRDNKPVALDSLAGKPLLISVIYTACSHSCSVATRYLDMAVQRARGALDQDAFNVVTVGFDVPVDRPETMREYAARYSVNDPDWYFLSAADPESMARLLGQLGFTWWEAAQGFDHVVQVTLLDSELGIYRQIYGENFDLPQLMEPLKDLVWNRPPGEQGMLQRLFNRVRLLCTVYDASGDRYVFDYSLFVGMAIGALTIGLALLWLLRETARTRGCT